MRGQGLSGPAEAEHLVAPLERHLHRAGVGRDQDDVTPSGRPFSEELVEQHGVDDVVLADDRAAGGQEGEQRLEVPRLEAATVVVVVVEVGEDLRGGQCCCQRRRDEHRGGRES